jgi:hypothetical protein
MLYHKGVNLVSCSKGKAQIEYLDWKDSKWQEAGEKVHWETSLFVIVILSY